MSEATEDLAPAGAAGPETRPDEPAVTPQGADVHEASESTAAPEVAEVAEPLDAADVDGEGEAAESSPGQQDAEGTTSAGGEGAPGKRKRRRRRRRKGEGEATDAEAAAAGEATPEPRRKRDAPVAPFMRFFVGAHAGRKHGFAVGEVVAGRVKEVANGSIAVDLFGKAMAYADEFEPREAPLPVPEPRAVLPEPSAAAVVAELALPSAGEGDATAEASSDAQEVEAPAIATEGAGGDAEVVDVSSAAAEASALDEAITSVATDAPASELDPDADADADLEATASGDVAAPGRGPLPPVPVVPESFPRPEPPGLGQVFRGRVGAVAESGHIAIVNRDVDRQTVLANLARYRDERRRVQGLVFGWNRGGFDVIVEGIRAFCPASAMTLEELQDPAVLLGHKLEFLLPASQSVAKDIIVSRRSILERQLRKKAKELVRSLEPGQRLKGRVTQVREFGVFVDIGGVEGLVHQSELSFGHGVKPSDVAQPGDEVEVKVLRVGGETQGGRRDRVERVSLSIKALLPDPWDAHRELLIEGSAQLGKVVRATDFGAFIQLAPHIEGLLHITEIGHDLKHANQVVKEGDELPVVIERVDRSARRIALSKLTTEEYAEYKAAVDAGAAPPPNLRPGTRIKVKVTRVESRGLLVRVAGVLGKRARGYVPSSELAGERGDLRKAYPIGAELEVKIVSLDRDGGLRCSPKALAVDEERKAVKDYRREAAKQGFGTFGDLLRAKLGQSDEKQ